VTVVELLPPVRLRRPRPSASPDPSVPADPPVVGAVPVDRDAAVGALYRSHAMELTRLASMLTSDRAGAEDVVQEAFAGLYRRWGALDDPARAVGYLRTAVVNGSRSRLRRRVVERRYEHLHLSESLATAPSAENAVLDRDDARAVASAVAALPRRQREVLVLRYHEDLSEAEIAEALGISRGAVKAYASRGLDAVAAALGVIR
jgi:RNA polymerase sigma-70 factor (sigma-E family)